MRRTLRRLSLVGFLAAGFGAAAPARPVTAQDAPKASLPPKSAPKKDRAKKSSALRIIDPVVCKSIEGYEDYEELPDAAQTSEEKLLVYYRPKGYKVVRQGDKYVAHFTQDGQVRRLGEKKVLLRKEKLLDYEAKSDSPPDLIYFRNTFSLKGLPPGEYEYDMILKDLNATDSTTTESVKFRIIPVVLPKADAETKTDADARF
jgi:hypothetical protein